MADGISTIGSLRWGTSSAGAAVSAEDTTTMGVDRQDDRTPPDLRHVWAAQLNNAKNLLLAMSATFKSGTRLGASTQTANPFAANEQGFWIDGSGNPRFSFGGVASTLATTALSTGNWTFSGNIADLTGPGALTLGGANATSILFAKAAVSLAANTVFTGAASSTNTTGISIVANVADGATSIAHDFNNTTSLTTTGFKFMRLRNANTEVGSITKSTFAAGGIRIVGDSAAFLELSLNGAAVFGYNSNYLQIGGTTCVFNGASPSSDGTVTLGTSAVHWPTTFSTRYVTKQQSVAFSATPSFNPNNGGQVHFGAVTANVTSITVTAGSFDGQRFTVVALKDGTANNFTMPGGANWGANVRTTAASYSMGTGAGAILVFDLVWDSLISPASWVMTHVPGNPI